MSSQGILPMEERVQVIRDFPQPTTQRQLHKFLGLINFYHRFIPDVACILQPLYCLLSPAKDSKKISWNKQATQAFTAAKEALSDASLLAHPAGSTVTNIMTDASDVTVGAVLQQLQHNEWHPIAYFSTQYR